MRKLAFVALLAACGGSDKQHQVVVIDAPIDTTPDSPPAQPVTVELQVFPTPTFIAYRDGAGTWQTPTPDSMGNYALTVTVDYQAVIVCADSTSSFAELLDATASDGNQFMFCNGGTGSTAPTTVAMTGHMVQAGNVYLGDGASSTTAPWDFTVNVPTGMHDLVATSTANGIVIRRNQNITAAGAIPSIDVSTEGSPMTAVPLTITGTGSDMLMTGYDLLMSNDGVFFSGSSSTIYTPPAALLTSNDYQFLFVEAYGPTEARFAQAQFNGSQTSFDLPATLTGVTFGPGKASFGTLPTYQSISFDMMQSKVEQQVVATAAWVAAAHATVIGFDAKPTGFNTAWSVDTSSSYQGSFQASWEQNGIDYGSLVFDGATVQRTGKRPWFSTVARVRESMRSQHTMPRR